MDNEKKLTEEDLQRIQRFLASDALENKRLAFRLIEQTAGPSDFPRIFTDQVLVELICLTQSADSEALIRAGNLAMQCAETWKRFQEAMINPNYLTKRHVDGMIRTNKIHSSWYPSKSFTLGPAAFDGFTMVSSSAVEKLLGNRPVRGSQSWGFGNNSLYLYSLEHLSDRHARMLSNSRCAISLPKVKTLSFNAAQALSMRDRAAGINLQGLCEVTNPVLGCLSKIPNLTTNGKISKAIRKYAAEERAKARKSSCSGPTNLTRKQDVKLRKLLRTKQVDQINLAIQLLHNAQATEADIANVFSTTIISLLVNTGNVEIFNSLAEQFKKPSAVRDELQQLLIEKMLNGHYRDIGPSATKELCLLILETAACTELLELRTIAAFDHDVATALQERLLLGAETMTSADRIAAGNNLGTLGQWFEHEGDTAKAMECYEQSVRFRVDYSGFWAQLAELKQKLGDDTLSTAMDLYDKSWETTSFASFCKLLNEAADAYPAFPWSYNNLAWRMATSPVEGERNGALAVEMATKACELSDDYNLKDTLAAAYAEAGDFEQATRLQQQVVERCLPEDFDEAASALERYKMRLTLIRDPLV